MIRIHKVEDYEKQDKVSMLMNFIGKKLKRQTADEDFEEPLMAEKRA